MIISSPEYFHPNSVRLHHLLIFSTAHWQLLKAGTELNLTLSFILLISEDFPPSECQGTPADCLSAPHASTPTAFSPGGCSSASGSANFQSEKQLVGF